MARHPICNEARDERRHGASASKTWADMLPACRFAGSSGSILSFVYFVHEFGGILSNSQRAVEIDFICGPPRQTGIIETFDVGQIARTG